MRRIATLLLMFVTFAICPRAEAAGSKSKGAHVYGPAPTAGGASTDKISHRGGTSGNATVRIKQPQLAATHANRRLPPSDLQEKQSAPSQHHASKLPPQK